VKIPQGRCRGFFNVIVWIIKCLQKLIETPVIPTEADGAYHVLPHLGVIGVFKPVGYGLNSSRMSASQKLDGGHTPVITVLTEEFLFCLGIPAQFIGGQFFKIGRGGFIRVLGERTSGHQAKASSQQGKKVGVITTHFQYSL